MHQNILIVKNAQLKSFEYKFNTTHIIKSFSGQRKLDNLVSFFNFWWRQEIFREQIYTFELRCYSFHPDSL